MAIIGSQSFDCATWCVYALCAVFFMEIPMGMSSSPSRYLRIDI